MHTAWPPPPHSWPPSTGQPSERLAVVEVRVHELDRRLSHAEAQVDEHSIELAALEAKAAQKDKSRAEERHRYHERFLLLRWVISVAAVLAMLSSTLPSAFRDAALKAAWPIAARGPGQ
jgi:hypothetical protein